MTILACSLLTTCLLILEIYYHANYRSRRKKHESSNSRYETDFGVSSAVGAGNAKIGFLKARLRRAFKKPIFIMSIVA
jgi:hypothetical protein